MDITRVLYVLGLWFMRIWKWGELRLIRAFITPISWLVQEICKSNGVVLHFTEEKNDNDYMDKDVLRVREKCGKYKDLVQIKVHDKTEFFTRLVNRDNLGLAEGFMDGIWSFKDSEEDIVGLVSRMIESEMFEKQRQLQPFNTFLDWLEMFAFNLQTRSKSFQVGKEHYDLGNDLYELMLDPWMQYTCGYWARANDLNQAQEHKLELIAKKLDLKPGMKVLDIGSGFGTLCKYLAERHGVECVGVTISEEQVAYAREKCKGLPVDIRLQDYRDVNEKFDRIVSVGMFEHVGAKNYKEFMEVVNRCLKDDGIFLLQTIGRSCTSFFRSDKFLHRYIFPNGQLPCPTDIVKYTDGTFVLEDWHNFGLDYAKTLQSWRTNFVANWNTIEGKYGERFYRMWLYYLCMFEGLFLTKKIGLWQVVLSKEMKREYRATR